MKNIDNYIKYRIKRAKETYEDARFLAERESWNSCLNRLYYSVFYAVIAILLKKGIEVKSHSGVKHKLGEELVKKGLISKDLAKIYGLLFDFRHKGDYDDLFEFDKDKVVPFFSPVNELIEIIENLIFE